MVLIWGWGNQYKKIADAGIMKCRSCNNFTAFEIRELAKNFNLYFIPVAKWGRKYYLVCNNCEGAYPLEDGKITEILEEIRNIPNNHTSIAIWNSIDKLFVEFSKNGTFEGFEKVVKKELQNEGYGNYEIDYVYSFYTQFIREGLTNYSKKHESNHDNRIIESKNVYCSDCGCQLPSDANFCKSCGKKI